MDTQKIISKIEELLQVKGDAVVAIEGRPASGKSYLAHELAKHFDCNIICMDDYYLPRVEHNYSVAGGNIDFKRFKDEVTTSIKNKRSMGLNTFVCKTQKLESLRVLEYKKLNIVEGSYSTHPKTSIQYDLIIYIDVSDEVMKERLLKRGEDAYNLMIKKWIPLEARYAREMHVKERADIRY